MSDESKKEFASEDVKSESPVEQTTDAITNETVNANAKIDEHDVLLLLLSSKKKRMMMMMMVNREQMSYRLRQLQKKQLTKTSQIMTPRSRNSRR